MTTRALSQSCSLSALTCEVHTVSGGRAVSHLVSELQLNNPEMVEGLVLINVNPCAEGWMDWAASKVSLGRAAGVPKCGGWVPSPLP